jgi:hypothetical protein
MAKKLSSIPSLHAFNPDTTTWISYRDRMGFYFHANGIVLDQERKSLFLWSVGDHVYSLLESLVAPRLLTEAELTYVNLIEILDKHYDDTKNIMTSTYNFFSCYQKDGQTFTEWKAELYDKVRRCGFTTSILASKPIDRAVRDMYVIGIRNPKIRQALLKEEDPGLEAAEKLILAAERLEQDVRSFGHPLKPNDFSVDKIHDKQFKFNKQQQSYSNKNRDYTPNNNNDKRRDYTSNNSDKDRTYNPCETCGSTKHLRSNCKFRDYTCHYCNKNGHLQNVCRQKKNEQLSTKHITTVSKLNSSNSPSSTTRLLDSSCMISLEVNATPITFEIDTGSSHTIISMSDWHRLQLPPLSSSKLRLKCYSGTSLSITGECFVPVKYNNHIYNLKLIVVQDAHPPLLGLQWIRLLQLDLNNLIRDNSPDIHHIHQVTNVDAFSTLPITNDNTFVDTDSLHVNFIQHEHSATWPLTPLAIAKATSTDSSPANLLFQHSFRTEFDIMKPTSSSTTTSSHDSKFVAGQLVWTLKYQHNHRPQWDNAFILKPIGSMLYEVRLSTGQVSKRHQNQLRPYYSSQSEPSTSYSLLSDFAAPKSSPTPTSTAPSPATPRYPQRNRHAPVRYTPP